MTFSQFRNLVSDRFFVPRKRYTRPRVRRNPRNRFQRDDVTVLEFTGVVHMNSFRSTATSSAKRAFHAESETRTIHRFSPKSSEPFWKDKS